jgi:hypothetical protein
MEISNKVVFENDRVYVFFPFISEYSLAAAAHPRTVGISKYQRRTKSHPIWAEKTRPVAWGVSDQGGVQ